MSNSYNNALKYLRDKYGYKRQCLTEKSSSKLMKARNKTDRTAIENSFTDRNYILKINSVTNPQDRNILLLLNQYQYGIAARKELAYEMEKKL